MGYTSAQAPHTDTQFEEEPITVRYTRAHTGLHTHKRKNDPSLWDKLAFKIEHRTQNRKNNPSLRDKLARRIDHIQTHKIGRTTQHYGIN
jgi:hypothetical protein